MNREPFPNIYKKQSISPEERKQKHKMKIIFVTLITLECMVGIGVIVYFATQGV